jgi:outer membrane protein TolC
MPGPRTLLSPVAAAAALLAAGCWSAAASRESADAEVYPILDHTSRGVTGQHKVFPLERPVDTLRHRLLEGGAPVMLSLIEALDVAAENSRDFQRQKEQLYLAALDLTRNEHDFAVRFAGGGSAVVSGTGDDEADVALSDNLSASVNSVYGTRVVASFVNTFLRSVVHGGSFDGSSILNFAITQPLLSGAGIRVVREPLTQAERDVVYAVRSFEHFRSTFAVRVVSEFYDVVRQVADLQNVDANYRSFVTSREQIEELVRAGRRTITDLGRAKQSEYSADAQSVAAQARLQTSLDRFKITLGLPVTANVSLDMHELDRLSTQGVEPLHLDEAQALAIALTRRYDHRTIVDQVEDAGRRILVSEDALQMALDFTAALNVPAESGKGLNLDWSRVNWSAGFNLDLALDKLVERNAYRSSLISFDAAVRAREASEDQVALDVRSALRNIQTAYDSYHIQSEALRLARTRVEATTDLYDAGRVEALEKLDAQDALLQAQLDLSAATVDYAVARLTLLRDLEGLSLEPRGLRYDPALPIPEPKATD